MIEDWHGVVDGSRERDWRERGRERRRKRDNGVGRAWRVGIEQIYAREEERDFHVWHSVVVVCISVLEEEGEVEVEYIMYWCLEE